MEPHTNTIAKGKTPEPSSASVKRLKGKVAVITGGARGIGAATARVFAANGGEVVIADVLDELGEAVAKSIGGRYVHCNVAEEREVEAVVEAAVQWKGRLDVMVNNAGVSGTDGNYNSITSIEMEEVNKVMSVNLNGTIHGIKHAARAMKKAGKGGSIICTSSTAARMGGMAAHSYTMSKAAVEGVVRSAACELGEDLIRVNCVVPHGVASEMLVSGYRRFGKPDITTEEVAEYIRRRGSLLTGRGATVEDVAQASLFLASDDSAFVTAYSLVVDGGYTAANSLMSYLYH